MKIHTEPSNLVGRPVESMQIMLRVVAEGNDRLIPVVPDGIFGRNTMAAVTAFQRVLRPAGHRGDESSHLGASGRSLPARSGAPVACRGNAAHFEPIPNPEAG